MLMKCEAWKDFVRGPLADTNEIESRNLGDTGEESEPATPEIDQAAFDDIFAMGGTLSKEDIEDFEKMLTGGASAGPDDTKENVVLEFTDIPKLLDEILAERKITVRDSKTEPGPKPVSVATPLQPLSQADTEMAEYYTATFWKVDLPTLEPLEDL
jgi:hypothetical protein